MGSRDNFLVNTKCPHCLSPIVVAISAFGSELSVRHKECKLCGKEFNVHILTITSTETDSVIDGEISGLRDRITYLNNQRKITKGELLLRVESARRLLDESLQVARVERNHYGEN